MNERELSLVKAVCEAMDAVIVGAIEQLNGQIEQHRQETDAQVKQLSETIRTINERLESDIKSVIDDAIAAIEPPHPPELPDVAQLVDEAVALAVAELPVPKDGQDGKSVTVEDVVPLMRELIADEIPELPDVKQLISDALAELPPPQDGKTGKDGADGRDALQLEILPDIDEQKSYERGTYATHNGGLWRAFEKTHGMRGWECVVDGVAATEVMQGDDLRSFSVTVTRSGGATEQKKFSTPVMVYRGVFKAGSVYQPGDTVTWGGSLWHCDDATGDKPGEVNSKGWTLAAKRGRDGRDRA